MCKYQRTLVRQIDKMSDFEFVKIESSKHLKIYTRHVETNTVFFTLVSSSPRHDSTTRNIQRNIVKSYKDYTARMH